MPSPEACADRIIDDLRVMWLEEKERAERMRKVLAHAEPILAEQYECLVGSHIIRYKAHPLVGQIDPEYADEVNAVKAALDAVRVLDPRNRGEILRSVIESGRRSDQRVVALEALVQSEGKTAQRFAGEPLKG